MVIRMAAIIFGNDLFDIRFNRVVLEVTSSRINFACSLHLSNGQKIVDLSVPIILVLN